MIEINNLTKSRIDNNLLIRVAKIVLRGENRGDVGLSIALVRQEKIKELNKKYRRKNRVTDVLSFSESKKPKFGEGLGEVVICPSQVKKDAKKYGLTFGKELARVLVHGVLHLLGYDHEKGKKRAELMEKKQNYYLQKIFLK